MRILLGGIFLMVWAAQADMVSNSVVPVSTVTVSNCLDHIDAVIARIEALAETATNNAAQVACLTEKLNKLHGLHDLAHNLNDTLKSHETDLDEDSAASDCSLILTACMRVDKLATEADDCQSKLAIAPRHHTPPPDVAADSSRPQVAKESASPASTIRDETTCLKQAKFAAMLADVMALPTGSGADAPSRELAKLAIEPLGGWSGDDCLTIDELCEVVAQVLNLKVEKPDDPYSYVQAVRNDGLPVDSLLPLRRRESQPALLLEPEVRRFLAHGYAAPLPSARRLQPN